MRSLMAVFCTTSVLALVGVLVAFPPGNSAEVAGWVQAFGSVAAISVAVWLLFDAKNEKATDAELLLLTMSADTVEAFRTLHAACEAKREDEYRAGRKVLEDLLTLRVATVDVRGSLAATANRMRKIIITSLAMTENMERPADWARLEDRFARDMTACQAIIVQTKFSLSPEAIRSAVGSILPENTFQQKKIIAPSEMSAGGTN